VSLLWRLSGGEAAEDSYLFGAMHVRDRRAFGYFDSVCARIDHCAVFAAELDLEAPEASMLDAGLLAPPEARLNRLLSSKRYYKLRRIVHKTSGLDLDRLAHFSPLAICHLIDLHILSSDRIYPLDEALWRHARAAGKTCMGLETYEEQLAVLRSIPAERQLQALLAYGRNPARHRRALRRMADLYERGDLRALHQAARRGAGGVRRLMFDERHRRMSERIDELARRHAAVCVVGAGHLAGERGVLRLLKRQGWKLAPLLLTQVAP
jgi:uncharacterized protein YbaP (TraB family)